MSVFDRYLEQAKDFARKLVRAETGTRRWATVTSVDPILITYDGPAPQGIISPVVLGTPVTIGDRVRAHTIHDKTYITRANPTPVWGRRWGGTQSIPSGAVTKWGFVGGQYEYEGMSGDQGGIIAQTAGLYQITAAVRWDTMGSGQGQMRLMVGGSIVGASAYPAMNGLTQEVSRTRVLVPGDLVTLHLYQNGGSAATPQDVWEMPVLSIAKIG